MKKRRDKVLNIRFKTEIEKVLKKFKEELYTLHDMATRDEKTKIYNNRFFMSMFDLEFEKAKRGKQKLSLAIIDIDLFKKFNDTHGHLIGDKILYELAQTLQKTTRKYDILARYGGEEFFVLLPETPKKTAKLAGERMRKGLWKNKMLKKYQVKVSVGVTSYKSGDTAKRMIKRADKALYKAKEAGRNRVKVI